MKETLNTVMEGVLVLDNEQRIALANDAFARTIGVPADALRGRRASDFSWIHSPNANRIQAFPWLRAISEGIQQRGSILRLRTGPEEIRKVSVNSTTILGDDGTCRAPWRPSTT